MRVCKWRLERGREISRTEMSQRHSPRWVWHKSSVILREAELSLGWLPSFRSSGEFWKIVPAVIHPYVTITEKEPAL